MVASGFGWQDGWSGEVGGFCPRIDSRPKRCGRPEAHFARIAPSFKDPDRINLAPEGPTAAATTRWVEALLQSEPHKLNAVTGFEGKAQHVSRCSRCQHVPDSFVRRADG